MEKKKFPKFIPLVDSLHNLPCGIPELFWGDKVLEELYNQ